MEFTPVGLDLAKSIFHSVTINQRGKQLTRKCLKRHALLEHFAQLEPTTVAMEACSASHHWAREIRALGHEVQLLPAQHITPYRVGQKNDYNDAEAIAKACLHGGIRPVPVKSVEQQVLQSYQVARSLVIQQRTALVNQIRGQLGEFGIAVPQGIIRLRAAAVKLLDPGNEELMPLSKELLSMQYEQLAVLDKHVQWHDERIKAFVRDDARCQALQDMPGIGPVVAFSLVSWMGDAHRFSKGRHASAALGLVPSQHSSGGKSRLGGISKCGDPAVRCHVVHGARAAIRAAVLKDKKDPLSRWAIALVERRGMNRATVALANKLVRIAWAILTTGEAYRAHPQALQAA